MMKGKTIKGLSLLRGLDFTTAVSFAIVLTAYGAAMAGLFRDRDDRAAAEKLRNEVRCLNVAASVHAVFSGRIEESADAIEVIHRLQDPSGGVPLVDFRLTPRELSASEVSSGVPRVVWNRHRDRFEILHGVVGGIKEFTLDESKEKPAEIAQRRDASLDREDDSAWMWASGENGTPLVANHRTASSAALAYKN